MELPRFEWDYEAWIRNPLYVDLCILIQVLVESNQVVHLAGGGNQNRILLSFFLSSFEFLSLEYTLNWLYLRYSSVLIWSRLTRRHLQWRERDDRKYGSCTIAVDYSEYSLI